MSPLSCYQCTNEKTNIHCVDDFNLQSCDKDTCQTITSYSGNTQVKRLLQEYFLLYFLRGNKTQNIFYGSFGIWRQRALPKKVLTRVWTTYRIAKYIPTLLRYFNLIQCGIFLYNFSTLKTTYGPHWLNTVLINVILWSLLKKILPI